jgi:carboxyl-terminal processing protease
MSALKPILAVVATLLVVGCAFMAGYVVNDIAHPDRVDLSQSERDKARAVGELQQRIIEELEGRYYKEVNVRKLKEAGADGALKVLDDPYTVYMTAAETKKFDEETMGQYSGIGVVVDKNDDGRLMVTDVLEGSPAQKAGMRAGDEIVSVDGKPARGEPVEVNTRRIKGAEGTKVDIEVRHAGEKQTETLTITRAKLKVPQTDTRIIEENGMKVGYLELNEFADGVGKTVRKDIEALEDEGAEAIVLDLRYNPGGFLAEAIDVTSDFLEDGLIVITEGLNWPRKEYEATGRAATDLPLVVLVNPYSASASEITAGALKDNDRATIIGQRSFGKGLIQTIVDLPDGATLKLTTAIYLTPDGTDINKKGIKPDIKAPDLPKTKQDETLDRALEYLTAGS